MVTSSTDFGTFFHLSSKPPFSAGSAAILSEVPSGPSHRNADHFQCVMRFVFCLVFVSDVSYPNSPAFFVFFPFIPADSWTLFGGFTTKGFPAYLWPSRQYELQDHHRQTSVIGTENITFKTETYMDQCSSGHKK